MKEVIASVEAFLNDPVQLGLVASYARPESNVTGILSAVEGFSAKQLEIAIELVPGAAAIGLLVNSDNEGNTIQRQEIEAAATMRGIRIIPVTAGTGDDLEKGFQSFAAEHVGAVIVLRDPLFLSDRQRIADLASGTSLPTISGIREYVEAGQLISYGVSNSANCRRAAVFVDKILKGAKPADLPVEFPTKYELVINLKTAKALGLVVPTTLLVRADEIIE